MTGALDGVRVLDLTQVILGPRRDAGAGRLRGRGAEDRAPRRGDLARAFAPSWGRRHQVPLRQPQQEEPGPRPEVPAGRSAFLALVPTADVVVSNFRPGVMEGLGLGYEHLRPLHPA